MPNQYTSEQVVEQLRKCMALESLNQTELARAIGVSVPFVNDILKGKRAPSGKILTYLGLERVVVYRTAQRR